MSKVRVYEVAREVGVTNRELVQRIAALGIPVRNHMSALDAAEVDRVKRALEKDKQQDVVEERIRPTVVRRRVVRKAPPVVEAAEAAELAGADPAAAAAAAAAPVAPAPAESAPALAHEAREQAAPAAAPAAAPPAQPAPVAAAPVREAPIGESRPSKRLDASLPPGVISRGSSVAPTAAPLSEAARQRIVNEHAMKRPDGAPPRRRELGRAALGPTGRKPGRIMGRPGRRRMAPGKKGKQTEITVPSAQKRVIRIEDQIQLQALAQRMSLKATDLLMKLMQLGMANVHINSTLDVDTAKILASDFGYEVENVARSTDETVELARGSYEDLEEARVGRAPIVTVMGHVDHGKTSLLDRIRDANVVGGEAGGITQHIGAYRVETQKGTVVFLDTPGHEAFTAMRARGASATDVVILVVAADDGVMPQTREAIHHSKEAGVPIVVAVNKIDLPDAKSEVVRNELASEGLQPEDWGGETIFVECSAVTGQGVDKLLESVVLQSELLELKANPTVPAEGTVLEAYLDRGRGPVANVLVRNGTLETGDWIVAGGAYGRLRAMTDDRGKQMSTAPPATPVEVLGLSDMPAAGDSFYVVTDQKRAQQLAEAQKIGGPAGQSRSAARGLDEIYEMMQTGDVRELKLVVKADVQGSIEAIVKALTDLSTGDVKVNVIHTGVGGITENDVMLASASNAVVVGFNVRPAGKAGSTAKKENVDVRMYSVIYEAVDEVKKAMAGLLAPKLIDKDLGRAEVRQVFSIPKVGTIAGCLVVDGKMVRSAKARLLRDSVVVWEGKLASLRRFKDDAREVASGYECGLSLEGFNDLKESDVVECFDVEEVAATLE